MTTSYDRLRVSDESAHFKVYQSEYLSVNGMAMEIYGRKLPNLTIGKAASLLRAVAIAPLLEISEKLPDTPQAVDAGLELFALETDLLHSIKTTGRITVDVMANDDAGQADAQPVETIEIIGDAWRRSHPDSTL